MEKCCNRYELLLPYRNNYVAINVRKYKVWVKTFLSDIYSNNAEICKKLNTSFYIRVIGSLCVQLIIKIKKLKNFQLKRFELDEKWD